MKSAQLLYLIPLIPENCFIDLARKKMEKILITKKITAVKKIGLVMNRKAAIFILHKNKMKKNRSNLLNLHMKVWNENQDEDED